VAARVGVVNDDSVKDLRRKIVRAGGNTALLIFGIEDMSRIYARGLSLSDFRDGAACFWRCAVRGPAAASGLAARCWSAAGWPTAGWSAAASTARGSAATPPGASSPLPPR
jgi:hypothetical protein